MKIFIKRTIVCILSAVCCFAFSACQFGGGESSSSSSQANESSQNTSSSHDGSDLTSSPVDDTPMSSSGSHISALTVDDWFPVHSKSSMVLVELIRVYEGFYTYDLLTKCVVAEYKVVTDYYQRLSKNTIIQVPFLLYETDDEKVEPDIAYGYDDSSHSISAPNISEIETLAPEILLEFLQQYSQAVIFLSSIKEQYHLEKNGNNSDSVAFKNIAKYRLIDMDFIPIGINDMVCIDDVQSFLSKNNCYDYDRRWRFPEFANNDMSLQQLEENIKGIYNRAQN